MTIMVKIDDKYISNFENFISSLPQDAVEIKNSLDNEISQRVAQYRSGQMQTTPFMDGLDSIREKLLSKL
jgi:hypothetical protein